MSEYASKGLGGTALGFGIGGAALSLMNNGGLGGIFGGCGNGCGDNAYINRYEAGKDMEIARLQSQLELRDANTYTMQEMGKLRDYMDNKFARVEHEMCDQRVYNATNTAALGCVQGQVAQLMALTKLVVPNTSVCPGWGDVTVSIPTTTTGG